MNAEKKSVSSRFHNYAKNPSAMEKRAKCIEKKKVFLSVTRVSLFFVAQSYKLSVYLIHMTTTETNDEEI